MIMVQLNRLQQQRLSLADTSLDEQKRLKEKAVHFADQAIEGMLLVLLAISSDSS